MADTALVVMARYPQAGKTKTRLARTIGDDGAVHLYLAFLTDLARRFAKGKCDLHWAYTPAGVDFAAFIATLVPSGRQDMVCFAQQGTDLGARLRHAFEQTYKQEYQRTIIIGSDLPHISLETIEKAQKALDEVDVVLGPADDGGYYLIAMREPHDVFSGIPMSTNVVTQMTIDLAQQQSLRIRLLEPLFDIDEWPDLLHLAQLLEIDSTLAPVTAAHLASLRSLYDHSSYSTHDHSSAFNLHRAD